MTSLAGSIIQIFKYYGIFRGSFSFLKLKNQAKFSELTILFRKPEKQMNEFNVYFFFSILGNKERDKSQSTYQNLSVFIQLLPFLETKLSS